MRVYSDTNPGSLAVGEIPGTPGFLLVRLFENVTELENGFVYDEYTIEAEDRPGLSEDIAGNIGGYLASAKAEERARLAASDPKGRAEAEAERIEMEQMYTDHYLDMVQAQQDITDLQIQIWEG